MKISLSGFAGVGKSTIIEHIKRNYPQVFISPESAREVNYTKEFFTISDESGEFFQKSVMDNEIMKVMLFHLNKIPDVIFDRSLVDNLAFAEIFYNVERIQYSKVQDFVDHFRYLYDIDYIYDSIVFIKSTQNIDFVQEHILNDEFRRATTAQTPEKFIERAVYWEEIYHNILNKVSGISPETIQIPHFSETQDHETFLNALFDDFYVNKSLK